MIVCLTDKFGDETFHEDVAAVVCGAGFEAVRLCRDGQPDEYVENDVKVCVVP